MIINIGVGISFLIVLFIIIMCFYSNMRVTKYENTIFIRLIFLTTIGLSIETFIYLITIYSREQLSFLLKPLVILLFIYYVVWMFLFVSYNLFLLNENTKKKINKVLLISIYTVFLFASIFLPFELEITDLYFYPQGIGTYAQYVFVSIGFTIIMINSLNNIKMLKSKKFIPLIVCMILGIVTSALQYFRHEFMFIVPSHAIAVMLMYFTIENPDIKMAKELEYQKQLSDASSKKTLELLEDLSNDLKSSVRKLEQFGNKKIDKNNIDELNKELTEFQESSIKLSDKISGIIDLAIVKGDSKVSEYKYEVKDMLDKLQQLLIVENENDNRKLNIELSNNIPNVVYGDESNVIKIVLYYYNLISSLTNSKEMTMKIECIRVGRFARLKFNYLVDESLIKNYIYKEKDTNELQLVKSDDVNYQIIENLLKKFNGKMIVSNQNDVVSISLCINQRLLTEYEIISNKEENKNIKVKYNDYSGKRILIVDNNNLNIKEMKVLLKPYNVEVLSVNTPNEMSEVLSENETFDLIFVDDIIPNFKLDDFTNEIVRTKDDFLRHIKDNAKYPILSIIMVNPNNENMEQKYLNYGFSDYILKPINKANLDKILNKYFKK